MSHEGANSNKISIAIFIATVLVLAYMLANKFYSPIASDEMISKASENTCVKHEVIFQADTEITVRDLKRFEKECESAEKLQKQKKSLISDSDDIKINEFKN